MFLNVHNRFAMIHSTQSHCVYAEKTPTSEDSLCVVGVAVAFEFQRSFIHLFSHSFISNDQRSFKYVGVYAWMMNLGAYTRLTNQPANENYIFAL